MAYIVRRRTYVVRLTWYIIHTYMYIYVYIDLTLSLQFLQTKEEVKRLYPANHIICSLMCLPFVCNITRCSYAGQPFFVHVFAVCCSCHICGGCHHSGARRFERLRTAVRMSATWRRPLKLEKVWWFGAFEQVVCYVTAGNGVSINILFFFGGVRRLT